jgi:ubiquinone/menaquinone biosynthesis C-methylase UbiE
VLEISAGTGRNLPHYNYSKLSSLTLTDISQPMLQQASAHTAANQQCLNCCVAQGQEQHVSCIRAAAAAEQQQES